MWQGTSFQLQQLLNYKENLEARENRKIEDWCWDAVRYGRRKGNAKSLVPQSHSAQDPILGCPETNFITSDNGNLPEIRGSRESRAGQALQFLQI